MTTPDRPANNDARAALTAYFDGRHAALFPRNHSALCVASPALCPQAVAPFEGRWLICCGHPGFNSQVNNGPGYPTELSARRAILSLTR